MLQCSPRHSLQLSNDSLLCFPLAYLTVKASAWQHDKSGKQAVITAAVAAAMKAGVVHQVLFTRCCSPGVVHQVLFTFSLSTHQPYKDRHVRMQQSILQTNDGNSPQKVGWIVLHELQSTPATIHSQAAVPSRTKTCDAVASLFCFKETVVQHIKLVPCSDLCSAF